MTGKFVSYADTMKVLIERKDGVQTETCRFGTSKYKLTCDTACNYVIELLETDIPFSKQNIGKKYYIKTTKIKNNVLYYDCNLEGTDIVDKGKMKKIK